MVHMLIGLVGIIVIGGAAITALMPDDASRRSGPENGWMNADYAQRLKAEEKEKRRLAKAAKKAGKDNADA
ncbi:hypothetical protein [Pacificimonas flava]|uniref:Uncharacterized protein n=1 Tax=Pacificimonas flava TaxID=1234595 RepID=M2U8H2_9SPHN|nr:hypothetical protein [Pacificimonas flava]EMD84272.1 hypothetical protein C725_0202 [Pacificimonas flava]MBB5279852.1 hypothetical protein [Pacificimonas flava]